MSEPTRVCEECGNKMLKRSTGATSTAILYEWRCGNDHKNNRIPIEPEQGKTIDERFMDDWEAVNR